MSDDRVEAQAANARVLEVWTRTVAALRGIVREMKITEDELHQAAAYFNRTGAAGVFPSLIDSTLAVTSLDVRRQTSQVRTRANVEGPFYRPGAPLRANGDLLDHAPGDDAEQLVLSGRVLDSGSGQPIPGAELDVWQADQHGEYDHDANNLRGIIRTDDEGRYRISTIVPADYSQHEDDPVGELYRLLGRHCYRAAHIHLKVRIDGADVLTTQLFMPDSPVIDTDYVIGAVSSDLILDKRSQDFGSGGRLKTYLANFDFVVDRPYRPTEADVAFSGGSPIE
jgi:protocatechuate 3,4-dioxygenase beta subunit